MTTITDAQVIELDVTGLSPAEIDDIRTHVKSKQPGPDTYFSPEHGWTCFHCGGTFYTIEGAKLHFGGPPAELPLCRKMAAELESLRAALAAAQAGAAPSHDENDAAVHGRYWHEQGLKQGFAAGVEAAAQEMRRRHDETMKWRAENAAKHGWKERASQDALERARAFYVAETVIRALRPPAEPAESEVMQHRKSEPSNEPGNRFGPDKTAPLSASEPTGAPSEEYVLRVLRRARDRLVRMCDDADLMTDDDAERITEIEMLMALLQRGKK